MDHCLLRVCTYNGGGRGGVAGNCVCVCGECIFLPIDSLCHNDNFCSCSLLAL